MSASYRDAAAGWEIYKSSGFSLTLAQINDILRSQGHRPIAPRTFDHYQRLRREGVPSYVPINQFDVDLSRHRGSKQPFMPPGGQLG